MRSKSFAVVAIAAALSIILSWPLKAQQSALSAGLHTASASASIPPAMMSPAMGEQEKPLRVEVRVDTSKVFSFSPVRLVLTTGVKKLFPTVQLQNYCLVAVTGLYRVDTITTETFPFAAVSDTAYALTKRGTADSMIVSTRLEQRHVVTIHSVYYDLKWKKVATPERFLPDVPWFQIK
jgi:hypothetical protein